MEVANARLLMDHFSGCLGYFLPCVLYGQVSQFEALITLSEASLPIRTSQSRL